MSAQKELEVKHVAEQRTAKSRLPRKTLAFIQHAFAAGAADLLDDRKKWLLVRYIVDERTTLDTVKQYAEVTTREGARRQFFTTLHTIWEASPKPVQQRFPKDVLSAKRHFSSDARARMRAARLGRTHSVETKAKIGVAQIGRPRTSETRELLSKSLTGKKRSEATKARMSAAHKGKQLTPETRAKISAANIGRKRTEQTRETSYP
jgi:hypothetical protein